MAAATEKEESNRIKATTNTLEGTSASSKEEAAAYYVESTLDYANVDGASEDGSSMAVVNATICNIDDIPLWKKELLQRRKTNLARTIGANQMTCSKKVSDSSSLTSTSPVMPLTKTLASPSSITSNTSNGNDNHSSHSTNEEMPGPAIIHHHTNASSGHYTMVNSCQQQQLACAVNTCLSSHSPSLASYNPKLTNVGGVVYNESQNSSATTNDGSINFNGSSTSGTCLTTIQQQQQQQQQKQQQLLLRQHQQQPDAIDQQQPFQLHLRLDVDRSQPSSSSSSCGTASGIHSQSVSSSSNSGSSVSSSNISSNNKIIITNNNNINNNNKSSVPGKCFIKNPAASSKTCKTNNKYQPNNISSNLLSVASNESVINSNANQINNNNRKMVAAQELNDGTNNAFDFDPSEELQYGPGIVSKLRCRYLSLALRQSANKQRPSLDILRRATSLNNLLDDDDGSNNSSVAEHNHHHIHHNNTQKSNAVSSTGNKNPDEFVATFQKNVKLTESDKIRARPNYRGNDSLKRARSVEALLVCDNKSWGEPTDTSSSTVVVQLRQRYLQHQPPQQPLPPPPPQQQQQHISTTAKLKDDLLHTDSSIGSSTDVTIEDKIVNARERLSITDKPPKRLTSFMDETERPPPDVVKQTLKIFEATANRRGRGLSRNNFSGEVAAKVANYKSIISQEKPPIVYPKPPLSPKKTHYRKPPSLDIAIAAKRNPNQTGIVGNVANNTKVTHPASPISNLAKKFCGTDVVLSTEPINEKPTSPQGSLSPVTGHRVDLAFRHLPKNESTPIRNTSNEGILPSPRTPDIIPRKHFENKVNSGESPVTQLTKKMEHLSIEMPGIQTTTTNTLSSTAPIPAQRKSPTSEVSEEYVNNVNDDDVDDDDDDDEDDDDVDNDYYIDGDNLTKPVTKLALENISKAGTTQEFSFVKTNNKTVSSGVVNGITTCSSSSPTGNGSLEQEQQQQQHQQQVMPAQQQQTTIKQIGVIRPLIAEPKIQTEKPKQNLTLTSDQPTDELSSRIHENFIISSSLNQTNNGNSRASPQLLGDNKPVLTTREIEKNLINEKKNEQANIESNASKWHFSKKKTKNPHPMHTPQNNTMVFNFKDRKEVPDYIENDGLLFKRKRELPKPNESGFVLLGEVSLETSTDPDDSWDMGPPSPCDVEFENANIIIDGKSSLRFRSKDVNMSLKVQFDDTLTSTFEYPSESSFLEDTTLNTNNEKNELNSTETTTGNVNVEAITKNSGQKLLGNMSLGSAPLGSYTPVKAQINKNFELGVTRAPPPVSSAEQNQQQNTNGNSSDIEVGSTKNNSNLNGFTLENGTTSEPEESLQYLKPATDDLTVVYSEGTQKTDLLY